jgi:cytochrome P450
VYSPIHAISRVALVDNTVGGYRVPAGTTVYISLYATHRLPQYWPDPERFDPERFTREQCESRSRFAYIPFAAGHRNCIGGGQAIVELKMVLAQISQRYVLDLVPGQRIEPAPGTTMYPRYGMKMTLRRAATRQ